MNKDFGPGVFKGAGKIGYFAYRFKKGRGKPEILLTVFERGGANWRFCLQILKEEGQARDFSYSF